VFGQPFVYESCIRDVAWLPHQVYCVKEEAGDFGKRVVDVGFPLMLVGKEGDQVKVMRAMCELKKGYPEAQLWRLCWVYFAKMKDFVVENGDVIACFVASKSFCNHNPKQRSVENGISAFESQANCLELMDENHRFMIFDNASSNSVFPLEDIFGSDEDAVVESLTDNVSRIYLGTPSK
jgi:hypothetical protein